MTIQEAIAILNKRKYRDRNDWILESIGNYQFVVSYSPHPQEWVGLHQEDAIRIAVSYDLEEELKNDKLQTEWAFCQLMAAILGVDVEVIPSWQSTFSNVMGAVEALKESLRKEQEGHQITAKQYVDLRAYIGHRELVEAETLETLEQLKQDLEEERQNHQLVKQALRDITPNRTELAEIDKTLIARLRGVYTIPIQDGAGPLYGETEFTRVHQVSPISKEAANALEAALNKIARLQVGDNYDR